MTPLQALEMLAQFIIEKDDNTDFSASVIEAHNEIKKALTPPTADEVCEEIENVLGEKIIYNCGSFYNTRETAEVCAIGNLGSVYFSTHLPPHIITLIGRFYEGQE